MEPENYKLWNQYQKAVEHHKRKSGGPFEMKMKTEEEEAIEDQLFESVSKRAWTDICLQLLKVQMYCLLKTCGLIVGIMKYCKTYYNLFFTTDTGFV